MDYWSKYEFGWHICTTANQHDAVAAVELALPEAEALAGQPLLHAITDPSTGEIGPVVVVTDNGGGVHLRPTRPDHRRPARTHPRPHEEQAPGAERRA